MRTEAQIQASRANGCRSHGPVTDEGKAISSKNSTKHGLLSNTAVLPGEDPAQFDRMLAAGLNHYDPRCSEEMDLVEEYTFYKWRQLRFWSLNTAAIAGELANQTGQTPDLLDRDIPYRTYEALKQAHQTGLAFPLMHRYEVSYANAYHRARRELRKVLAAREARERGARDGELNIAALEAREKIGPCCSFPNEPNPSTPPDSHPVDPDPKAAPGE